MKVTLLDKRHNGYGIYSHMVEPTYSYKDVYQGYKDFQLWREWCWTVFGSGCERDWASDWKKLGGDLDKYNWVWDTEFQRLRIYFKKEEQLSAFMLQWQKFN